MFWQIGVEQSLPVNPSSQSQLPSIVQEPLPEQLFGQIGVVFVPPVEEDVEVVSLPQFATQCIGPTSGMGARPWANKSEGNNKKNNNKIRNDLIKK